LLQSIISTFWQKRKQVVEESWLPIFHKGNSVTIRNYYGLFPF